MGSTTTMEEIQALNMIGLDLMEQENFTDAAAAFSYCISELSWCILSPTPLPTSSCCTMDGGGDDDSHKRSSSTRYCRTSSSAPSNRATVNHVDHQQEQHLIEIYTTGVGSNLTALLVEKSEFFPHPFAFEFQGLSGSVLDPCSTLSPLPSSSSKELPYLYHFPQEPSTAQHLVMTTCCLYNMALCHHLEWVRRNKLHAGLLEMALSYYEQAFTAACSKKINGCFVFYLAPSDPILNVLMAICVNATHCHCELGNVTQVRTWNQKLCNFLRFSQNHQKKRQSPHQNEEEQDENEGMESSTVQSFFVLNAFLNGIPRLVAPAA